MKTKKIPAVNAHMHTPYSFSAFTSIEDALDRAQTENVRVVGINDFYTTNGYKEWAEGCAKRRLYPLFGLELVALDQEDQQAGLRVNDPVNPGRTYLVGKGMAYPCSWSPSHVSRLESLVKETNKHTEEMCRKVNELLERVDGGFSLYFDKIRQELTKGLVKERHLAMALRLTMWEHFKGDTPQVIKALDGLFAEKTGLSSIDDAAALDGLIRTKLFKANGAAFVPEDPGAFLPVDAVIEIILGGGGIPTYPFLGDDPRGNFTEFEQDRERVAERLTQRGIHGVEFIPSRNDAGRLEEYVVFLHDNGFVVTFGSEHNTPMMEPIELFARGGVPLSERLKEINYRGACVIAAHQHVVSQGLEGYVDETGEADRSRRREFEELGDELIRSRIELSDS